LAMSIKIGVRLVLESEHQLLKQVLNQGKVCTSA